ncbi:MAG: DNA repair protein RecO (recombination protein O) [Bacillota bacterium]|nr:MAG: DNA repair protein RecO (recombination protein O) [Bacillota bacterium]
MGQFKGEGIVLRSMNLGEWDKLLTVFTQGQGRLKIVAKGARKIQSRYASLTQLFCNIRFTVYQGKSVHTFSQVELIEGFRPLREDLGRMAYGIYMLEMIDATLEEGQSHDDILSLLIACLHILSHTDHLELLLAFYELRLLSRLGWGLSLESCPVCGGKMGAKFSIQNLGFPCSACIPGGAGEKPLLTISLAAYSLLKTLCGGDWRRLEALPTGIPGEKEVAAVLDRIIYIKLEKRLESYVFLSQIRSTAR